MMSNQATSETPTKPPPSGWGVLELRAGYVLVLAGIALPALLAILAQVFLPGSQSDLASPIPGLAAGTDRITALAWSPDPEGPLFVGTQQGRLFRTARSGSANAAGDGQQSGPIVSIFPKSGTTDAEVVWLDETGTYRISRGSATHDGLAFMDGKSLRGVVAKRSVSASPGDEGKDPVGDLGLDLELEKTASAVQGFGNSGQGALVGTTDGEVIVMPPKGDAALLEPARFRGAIVGIATSTEGGMMHRFAILTADGTVAIYGSPNLGRNYTSTVFQSDARSVRDGLFLSRDGRVLMVSAQDGGILIARLNSDSDSPKLLRMSYPYPLPEPRTWLDSLPWRRPLSSDAARTSVATLSPRGDLFAVAGDDGRIRVVSLPADENADPASAESFMLSGHRSVITHLAISSDGKYLASAGIDGRLWLVDLDFARGTARWPLRDLPTGPPVSGMKAIVAARPSDSPSAVPVLPSAVTSSPETPSPATSPDFAVVVKAIETSIDQISRAVTSMARSCPGGASGVDPFRYAEVAAIANDAARSLKNIRDSLSSMPSTRAGVNYANQLTAVIDMLMKIVPLMYQSCSGGRSGQNPFRFDQFSSLMTSSISLLQRTATELPR